LTTSGEKKDAKWLRYYARIKKKEREREKKTCFNFHPSKENCF